MLSSSSLTEEGVEGVVSSSDGLITGHLTVRLDPMFQTVQFPACIANLDASLANVDGDALTLIGKAEKGNIIRSVHKYARPTYLYKRSKGGKTIK